jgi:quercetin dioxygenase-like cupin family protein
VTGLDADGKSRVLLDGATPGRHTMGPNEIDILWRETSLPPSLAAANDARGNNARGNDARDSDSRDPADVDQVHREPPPGGLEWRVVSIPPTAPDSPPEWHVTPSIDFGIILSGEIELQLEREHVRLAAGDCIVQRGARHRWVNHGPDACVISFTNISARPHDVVD